MKRIYLALLLGLIPLTAAAGGLYNADTFTPLASDIRSFRVGDAITIMIVEASSAQSQADTSADRETNVTAGVTTVHMKQTNLGLDLKRHNGGQAATTRAGQLQAEISVRIQQVAANGDLIVRGSQKILINGEEQRISLAGIVRPIDVSADNVVLSTRLTDSEIEYSGKGFVSRNQEESWISRLFGFLGF
ncbi:MAG: flagellar basal body L-ring protein FlgH [Nevskia sp.]|nr:flagellar basal body L-ring protein FlgH [Nevskia sp.]